MLLLCKRRSLFLKISVIIPALNEERNLSRCLQNVRMVLPGAEIIVCDGGSADKTCGIARDHGALVCSAPKGRGLQLNAGAKPAQGDIFLFLHADTLLPPDASRQITDLFRGPHIQIATFRMRFDENHWLLGIYSYFTRFDSILTSFGDQGVVIRKDFFAALGGFPDWPLFEDVRLLHLARRKARVYSIPSRVTTSARRFRQRGFLRHQFRNGWYILQYLCGVSPHRLALTYGEVGSAEGKISFSETAH